MSLLLWAHRGACRLAPENTIAAFRLALDAGCDGCECDVQLSSDGALVVFHDETLTRLAGLARTVPELTARQLAALRITGPRDLPAADTNIPTLQSVWELHRSRRKLLFVELKYFREEHLPRERLGEAVLQFVQAHRPDGRFRAIAFDEPLLEWLKHRLPTLSTGYIFDDPARFLRHQATCHQWADALLPRVTCTTDAVMAWAQQAELPVYPWVADDEATAARLTALGVDGLLTNEPARLVAWAQQHTPRATSA